MKKNLKILKKTTKVLSILFLTILSSIFIFSNDVKALSDTLTTSRYIEPYKYIDTTNFDKKNCGFEHFDNIFNNYYEQYKNDYPYYLITAYKIFEHRYFMNVYFFDNIPNLNLYYYYNDNGAFQMAWTDGGSLGNFNVLFRYLTLDYEYSGNCMNSMGDNGNGTNNNIGYSSILYYNNFTLNNNEYLYSGNPKFYYDSNFHIKKVSGNLTGSGRTDFDVKIGNKYYSNNDILLSYKKYINPPNPTIDFSYKNNITTINDTNYTTSKDVTINLNNYDSSKHLLQYQFVKSGENLTDNWITHTFSNNENTLTLNYKENGSLYTRVLDIENNYELIYSNTFTFDDITLFHDSINIDTSNLGYIKVNFDLSNFNDDDFEYTRLLNVPSRLKEAYIHQTYADSCVGSSCMDIFYARDNLEFSNLLNSYTSHSVFQINRTYILTDFYIYYDVSDISDTLTLNIDSTKPFNIEYGYLDDYVDNSITLNLKGYRGLVLYPKVSNYDGNYPFYLNNVDINIFEYNKNTLIDYYNNITSDIYYINNIKNYQKTRYYLLQNNKLNEDSYITFDTRYFNYQYVTSDEEDIVIENPNIGFNTTIPSINESDFQKDYLNVLGDNDFHSIIDYMRSLLDDLQETSNAFNEIFHSFYDNLPSIVQVGLVCGYTLLLIIISLKLGGWNND